MKRPAPPVVHFAATQAEHAVAARALRSASPFEMEPFAAARGTLYGVETVLVRTGMGPGRAAAAVERLFEMMEVSEVLLTGFGGGLDPGLQVAQLVLCSEAVAASSPGTRSERLGASEALLRRARRTRCPLAETATVTVDHLVTSAEEKRCLRVDWEAGLVDMEGHAVLAASLERGLPALPVRAVFDAAEDDLPDWMNLLTPWGGIRKVPFLSHIARHPKDIVILLELGKRIRACQKVLGRFISCYFTLACREGVVLPAGVEPFQGRGA